MSSTPSLFGITPEQILSDVAMTLHWPSGELELMDVSPGDHLLGPNLPDLAGDHAIESLMDAEEEAELDIAAQ